VKLLAGGLATSGTAARRWLRGGELQHHLLDPRTGQRSASPWTHATVAAGSCVAADVAAKAAFLLGEDGPDWLDERGLPGRFVSGAGATVVNRAWRRAAEPAEAASRSPSDRSATERGEGSQRRSLPAMIRSERDGTSTSA
jgi:thiamine biosynthesis lipoprotein ApbE